MCVDLIKGRRGVAYIGLIKEVAQSQHGALLFLLPRPNSCRASGLLASDWWECDLRAAADVSQWEVGRAMWSALHLYCCQHCMSAVGPGDSLGLLHQWMVR